MRRIHDLPIELHDAVWRERVGINNVIGADPSSLNEHHGCYEEVREIGEGIFGIEHACIFGELRDEIALMRSSIKRHPEPKLEDRKLLHHLIAPAFTQTIETSREIRRVLFGKSSATVITFVNTPRTHLHEVHFALHACFQNDDRTRDIAPERLHFMIFAPIHIRSPRFPGAVDDDVRLLSLENFSHFARICNIAVRGACLRVDPLKTLPKVPFAAKNQHLHKASVTGRILFMKLRESFSQIDSEDYFSVTKRMGFGQYVLPQSIGGHAGLLVAEALIMRKSISMEDIEDLRNHYLGLYNALGEKKKKEAQSLPCLIESLLDQTLDNQLRENAKLLSQLRSICRTALAHLLDLPPTPSIYGSRGGGIIYHLEDILKVLRTEEGLLYTAA